MPARHIVALVGTFATVTWVMTLPLSADLTLLPDHDDSYFNVWRLAWVAHSLSTNPATLFDGNIFVPASNTLAYSDAMLALALLAAPFIWAGVHPAVAHAVLLLLGFLTAGLAAFWLCRYVSGSAGGAVVGAIVFAFAPYRFAHIGHLELLWTAPMPLTLLVLHKTVDGRYNAWRGGALTGLLIALQAYCGLYYAVFLTMAVGVWALATMLLRRDRQLCLRLGGSLLAAAMVAGVLVLPYGQAYLTARQNLEPRSSSEIRQFSATPSDYLRVSVENKTYPAWHSGDQLERSLFPGFTPVVLALVAVIFRRPGSTWLYLILLVVAFDCSLGSNGTLYPLAMRLVPLLDGLRAPSRFGVLVLLSLSVLAASGVTSAERRLGRRATTAVCCVLVALEYWCVPVRTRQAILDPPAVYAWLHTRPPAVVLELPVPSADALWRNEATHQYMSIFHWQRLVNGYSGYAPRSYLTTLDIMQSFPSPHSIQRLRRLQVDFVIVHERLYEPQAFTELVLQLTRSREFEDPREFDDPIDPATVFALRR